MAERTYRWLLITLAVVGLGVDQASKYGVFRWLYNDGQGGRVEVVEGWFRLIAQFDPTAPPCDCGFSCLQTWSGPTMPHVNRGALFGLGNSEGNTANWFFAGVSVVAAGAILVWGTRRGPAKEKWLSAALGLILGGTVGNLYDRIVFGGVRDFLYFYRIEWPVFNVADCCLVVGAGLLLLQAMFASPKPDPAAPVDAASANIS
ncbi:MAG TPA: signal peptidase II [Gemmataceae bacterium]|nr:signal peptidase II [Gemmataceae bacterium]